VDFAQCLHPCSDAGRYVGLSGGPSLNKTNVAFKRFGQPPVAFTEGVRGTRQNDLASSADRLASGKAQPLVRIHIPCTRASPVNRLGSPIVSQSEFPKGEIFSEDAAKEVWLHASSVLPFPSDSSPKTYSTVPVASDAGAAPWPDDGPDGGSSNRQQAHILTNLEGEPPPSHR
jgi:hypothetical protein